MSKNYLEMPRAFVDVDCKQQLGPLEWWRHSVGHGGVNGDPLPDRVALAIRKLKPRLIRVFLQEYFNIYPDHGVFDWSRLDPFMASLQKTGAKVMATVNFKPPVLYPAIDEKVWRPMNVAEWQNVIYQLVKRYSVDNPIVTHWEHANETDIGENGGCPFLIPTAEENYEFYKMLIKPVFEAFPGAKVGGPAAAIPNGAMFKGFIKLCHDNNTPLDFVSWHCYDSDPATHRKIIEHAEECVSIYQQDRPALVFNEINMGFDFVDEGNKSYELISVEELALSEKRAAFTAANVISMMKTGLDWSHYYLIWDGCMHPNEFRQFFSENGVRNVMYKHWNETPHRFGLFSESGTVRPQYFVFQMLSRMGDTALHAKSANQDLKVLAAKNAGSLALLIANYNLEKSIDAIARCRFSQLDPGKKRLTICRIDGDRRWDEDSLELIPIEQRSVDTLSELECQCYCPADSVVMVLLEDL